MRGVVIVEYALSRSDLARLDAIHAMLISDPRATLAAEVVGARSGTLDLDWLERHPAVGGLGRALEGTEVRLSGVEAVLPERASWFAQWHPCTAGESSVELLIFLDACDEQAGPLEVIPGSHTSGALPSAALAEVAAAQPSVVCLAARGDILVLAGSVLRRRQRARLNPTGEGRIVRLRCSRDQSGLRSSNLP